MKRALCAFLTILTAAAATSCRATPAPAVRVVSPDTWAVVDGREIKREDVEKAYQRAGNASANVPAEDALTAKLSLLDELIIQDILLAKARTLKIELPVSELEKAYAEAKKNISDEAFQQELTRRKVTADDMREGLRRELLAQKVIEQEVGSKVAVTDQEVTDFFNANRAQFNVPEEGYHLAQIVVTPVARPPVGEPDWRRCDKPAGGAGEGTDVDGAAQGWCLLRRTRCRLFGGSGVGAARRRPRARADVETEAGASSAARRRPAIDPQAR